MILRVGPNEAEIILTDARVVATLDVRPEQLWKIKIAPLRKQY